MKTQLELRLAELKGKYPSAFPKQDRGNKPYNSRYFAVVRDDGVLSAAY